MDPGPQVEPEEAERPKIMAGHRRDGGAAEELPQDARLACRVPVEAQDGDRRHALHVLHLHRGPGEC